MHLGTFLVSHSNKDLPNARIYWLRWVALLHFLALPARDAACLIALFRVAWRHVVCARRRILGVVQVCAFLLLVLLLCGADGAINARQQPNSDVPPLVLHLELDFSGCSMPSWHMEWLKEEWRFLSQLYVALPPLYLIFHDCDFSTPWLSPHAKAQINCAHLAGRLYLRPASSSEAFYSPRLAHHSRYFHILRYWLPLNGYITSAELRVLAHCALSTWNYLTRSSSSFSEYSRS